MKGHFKKGGWHLSYFGDIEFIVGITTTNNGDICTSDSQCYPAVTPDPTTTPTQTPSMSPSQTATVTPTKTPQATPTQTPTNTATPTQTRTPNPTPSSTPILCGQAYTLVNLVLIISTLIVAEIFNKELKVEFL